MSTIIYDSTVRTPVGEGGVRITDTTPTAETPGKSTVPADAPIELEMGDRGERGEGLPTSIGSALKLQFEDPSREFQRFFREAFDDQRFKVDLEIPTVGTWQGFIRSTLQGRWPSQKTHAGRVSVTCFDGLALLKKDDTAVNARTRSVADVLVDAFGEANAELDIVAAVDPSATDVGSTSTDIRGLFPIAKNARSYEPPQPNGPSGEEQEEGLPGDSLRAQLDALCTAFGAAAYQDVQQGVWAFVDVASVGAPVEGLRWDGSSWSTYTLPEQTVTVGGTDTGGARTPVLRDQNEDAFRTQESVRAVCTTVRNWITDPGFEVSQNGDDLVYWSLIDVQRNSDGYLEQTSTGVDTGAYQTVDFSGLDIFGAIDGFRLLVTGDDNVNLELTITYGNGDTYSDGLSVSNDRFYAPKDPNGGHSSIDGVEVRVDPSDTPVHTAELNLIRQTTDNPIDQFGINNKFEIVERACYAAQQPGRSTVEGESVSFLVKFSGQQAPPQNWTSSRYSSGPFDRFSSWRATNLLELRPPPYERLSETLLGAYAPLGTRLKLTKPGADEPQFFVPLKSRTLTVDTGLPITELEDVELPTAVTDPLP
jgi:hypothetical protein